MEQDKENKRINVLRKICKDCRNQLTEQTSSNATMYGKRNPDRMLRKMLPGMANVCKLHK